VTGPRRHDERSQIAAFRDGRRDHYDDVASVLDHRRPSGVVSNNHHSTVAFLLEHFGWTGTFDTYYGREMSVESLQRKKPNTHYLERALGDLGTDSALYVGDGGSDVLAAHRAGSTRRSSAVSTPATSSCRSSPPTRSRRWTGWRRFWTDGVETGSEFEGYSQLSTKTTLRSESRSPMASTARMIAVAIS